MPWSHPPDLDPPPMTRGQRILAIVHRVIIAAVALVIITVCATGWFMPSAVLP